MFISGDAALYFRRGWTHGVLAMVVLPMLLAGSVWLWHRWRGGGNSQNTAPPFRPRAILLLAYLAVWSHPLLDWLNTYGVRFLSPFSDTWFYGDTLFIIDPWLWLLTAAGIVLAHTRSRPAITGWAILAAISTGLVFATGFVATAVKVLWVLGIAAIVLLRLGPTHAVKAPLVARSGLVILLLYTGTTYLLAREAESALREQFPHASVVQANPVPGNPMAHRLLVVEEGLYRIVSPTGDEQQLPREEETAAVRQALASPEVRGFSNWMRFPYWEVEESEAAWTVNVWDLRYQMPGQTTISGIGFVRVVVPKPSD